MDPQSTAFASSGLVARMDHWATYLLLRRLVMVQELVLRRLASGSLQEAVELLPMFSAV